MNIGTLQVSTIKDEIVFSKEINNVTISGGRIFIQIDGSFFDQLPFQKNVIYKLQFNEIQGMEKSFLATYEDYMFNAGSTDTIDEFGQRITGVCVLSNQLQFMLVY